MCVYIYVYIYIYIRGLKKQSKAGRVRISFAKLDER